MKALRRLAILSAAAALGALAVAGQAGAASSPSLLRVSQTNRHASAQFAMPGADSATIYFATKPDRATDGSFLEENVEHMGFLTSSEIQSGSWFDESRIDPGRYYVMIEADDWDCFDQAGCLNGYSSVLTLDVPKPAPTYRATTDVLHYVHVTYLTLRVKPLGERLPYKVCWRLKNKKRRCVKGAVSGYSWDSSAESMLDVSLRGMGRRTTFTWYVNGSRVATKTANTRAL